MCQKPKWNDLGHGILAQHFRMQNLVHKLKSFFWESQSNLKTLQKLSPYIRVAYKFVLKCVKSQNPIFRTMQYWFQTWECQIWLRNIKPYFEKNQANLETRQKCSLNIRVNDKFVLKCVKSQNLIFRTMQYWFKTWECQIWLTNTKPFFWKSHSKVETLQKLSP